jgi:ferredoxin-thioredoxin reductase catalytic chain
MAIAPRGRFRALGSVSNETPWFRYFLQVCVSRRSHTTPLPMSEATSPSSPAVEAPADSLEVIRRFAETYAQRTGTYFCSDPGVTAVVLEGLARHKDELGGALCPCRHYEDKEAEVAQAFWNCPCVPMRERKECHCMLFLTEDNPFRGEKQSISLEEIKTHTSS